MHKICLTGILNQMEKPKSKVISNIKKPVDKQEGVVIAKDSKNDKSYSRYYTNTDKLLHLTTQKLYHQEGFNTIKHDIIHIFVKSRLDSLGVNTPSQTTWENEMMVLAFQYLVENVTQNPYEYAKDALKAQIQYIEPEMLQQYEIYRGYLMQLVAIFLQTLELANEINRLDPLFLDTIRNGQEEAVKSNVGNFRAEYHPQPLFIKLNTEQISKLNHCIEFAAVRKERALKKLSNLKENGEQQLAA